ncbi:MAG: periplasmic protease [Bacteroidetes bacterium OLB12]|nr:MAG: periplasmic protease [Bacteroidetes bacterium OLB12]HNU41239.1 S41 family peptidase [Cyclobacteriaceae bacterium]
MKYRGLAVLAFAMGLTLSACKEDDEHPNEYVNNWIEVNMDFWYYWNTTLPSDPDKTLAPDKFFESLLNDADRFSWIQDNYQELLNSLQGVNEEAGYELALFLESEGSTNVIAQIVYIKPASPAEAAGLKRGDVITHINSQQLNTQNYKTVLAATGDDHTLTYRELDLANETFLPAQTKSLTTVVYAENPNFLSKVFTHNDRKIGYYVYNLFSTGPVQGSTTYNTEMDYIFASFQSVGITDLIIDLRFNSGGAESATVNLASLVGKGVDATKVFTIREYNTLVEAEIKSNANLGAGFLDVEFLTKAQNVGNQLTNNRVYILTGTRTASASELLINGLRPYMDVFLIGSTTVGKNVGSISIFNEDDTRNTWGMQPIVTKSLNSLEESDYSNGFEPQVALPDNNLIVYPLGDERELLLSRALQEITGGDPGRVRAAKTWSREVGHSLDLKKHSNVLIIDASDQQKLMKMMKQ